ncbi:MAG: hypothetical protein VB108_00700 [Anaerolineaceae bacterium]|nr:hypothetical protein [Anaerolineaceae bacterium]
MKHSTLKDSLTLLTAQKTTLDPRITDCIKQKIIQRHQKRQNLILSILLVFLLSTALMVFTRPGRALAQEISRYFQKAEHQSTDELGKTYYQEFAIPITYSLTRAEELAGFQALRLPELPLDYHFSYAEYSPRDSTISQRFTILSKEATSYVGPASAIILKQSKNLTPVGIGEKQVVETQIIKGITVESIKQTADQSLKPHISPQNINNPKAPSNEYRIYRWQKEGFYYSLIFLNEWNYKEIKLRLDEGEMVEVLELALGARKHLDIPSSPNYVPRPFDLEEKAGFTTLVPSEIPLGYAYSQTAYDPKNRTITFTFLPMPDKNKLGFGFPKSSKLEIVEKLSEGKEGRNFFEKINTGMSFSFWSILDSNVWYCPGILTGQGTLRKLYTVRDGKLIEIRLTDPAGLVADSSLGREDFFRIIESLE